MKPIPTIAAFILGGLAFATDLGGARVAAQLDRGRGVALKNDLSQLALLYNQYALLDPGPANLDELKANVKKDAPNVYKLIESGVIEVIFRRQIEAGLLLAYQKEPDKDGMQLAAFGDRSVKKVTKEELKKLLK